MPIYEIFAPLVGVDNWERKQRIGVADCVSEVQVEDYALTLKGFVADNGKRGSWSELHVVHVNQDLVNKRHALITLIAAKQGQVAGLADEIARHSKDLADLA